MKLIFLILTLSINLFAQSATITGKVTDTKGQGIGKAVISAISTDCFNVSTLTNSLGFYKFLLDTNCKSYVITVKAKGIKTFALDVYNFVFTVASNQGFNNVDFQAVKKREKKKIALPNKVN